MTDLLAELRDRFRARAAVDRAELEELVGANPAAGGLQRLVHNLAGSAGMFGFGPLSQAAAEVDDQMTSGAPADPASLDRLKARLEEVAESAAPRLGSDGSAEFRSSE